MSPEQNLQFTIMCLQSHKMNNLFPQLTDVNNSEFIDIEFVRVSMLSFMGDMRTTELYRAYFTRKKNDASMTGSMCVEMYKTPGYHQSHIFL